MTRIFKLRNPRRRLRDFSIAYWLFMFGFWLVLAAALDEKANGWSDTGSYVILGVGVLLMASGVARHLRQFAQRQIDESRGKDG